MAEEFVEQDLALTLADGWRSRKFDERPHGMSHCMKAVDLVIDSEESFLLVEFKDPENGAIPAHERARQLADFREKMKSGALVNGELAKKWKDTLLYLLLKGELPDKPVTYVTVLGLSALDPPLLVMLQEQLRKACCMTGSADAWRWRLNCAVLTIDAWNRRFAATPIRRLSAGPA